MGVDVPTIIPGEPHFWLGRLLGSFGDRYDYYLLQLDLTPIVLIGRSLGVAAAAGVTWVGSRLGGRLGGAVGTVLAGGMLALSPLLVNQAQLITPDILLVFFAALALSRIVDIRQRGRIGDYVLAGVWIGLSASCKYTPVLLIPILVLAHWQRRWGEGRLPGLPADAPKVEVDDPPGGVSREAPVGSLDRPPGVHPLRRAGLDDRRLWLAGLACALAFGLTSPYVVANWNVFQRDFSYQALHLGQGHIGQQNGSAWLFYVRDVLPRALGWPGLVLAMAGLVWASWRKRGVWLLLLLCVLVFTVMLGLLSTRFDRYLLPVLLPLALGPVGLWVCGREAAAKRLPKPGLVEPGSRSRRSVGRGSPVQRFLVPTLLILACVLPPALTTLDHHRLLARPSTLQLARLFILEELAAGPVGGAGDNQTGESRNRDQRLCIALEPYCPELPDDPRDRLQPDPVLPLLSTAQRERLLDQQFFHLLYMPFYISHVELAAFYYDLRHLLAYDYVVTSGAVRRRYEDEPERFPRQRRFYRDLDRYTRQVAAFAGPTMRGPDIHIYRLDDEARRRLVAARGPLGTGFYREFLGHLHNPHFFRFISQVALHAEYQGRWDLVDLYFSAVLETQPAELHRDVLPHLAQAKLQTGQIAAARDLYRRLLELQPDDATFAGLLGYALEELGDLDGARGYYLHCLELSASAPNEPANQLAAAWARERLARLGD